MRLRNCAIIDCYDRKASRHRFPNPKIYMERFQNWLMICKNEKLFTITPEKIYKNYRVCHKHFTTEDILSNNILNKTAIPSIALPNREPHTEQGKDNY